MLRLGGALYKVDCIENFKLEKPTKALWLKPDGGSYSLSFSQTTVNNIVITWKCHDKKNSKIQTPLKFKGLNWFLPNLVSSITQHKHVFVSTIVSNELSESEALSDSWSGDSSSAV